MATTPLLAAGVFEVDPVSRIEGHLGVKVTTNASGVITEANAHGNLWRGFENFLVGRRVNDAITFTQRICGVCPVPHGSASTLAADSVMGISDGYATFDNSVSTSTASGIPPAALLVRNIVLATEFLMSSITHFYHLAAQDYIQGPNMKPWTPYFPDRAYNHNLLNSSLRALPVVDSVTKLPVDLWSAVIEQYVKALRIRRLTFEAGAMFAGRMPMMSMSIAGGTTNNFRSRAEFEAKCDAYSNIMTEVAEFVIREYVPLAFALGALYPTYDSQNVSKKGFGAGLGNFLAWGAFPATGSAGTLAIKGGVRVGQASASNTTELLHDRSGVAAAVALVKANLTESIARSRYADTLGEFGTDKAAYPGDVTRTIPARNTDADGTGSYSWMKAPRWAGQSMEVGPLARMVVNGMYLVNGQSLFDQTDVGANVSVVAADYDSATKSFGTITWPQAYAWLYFSAANTLDGTIVHPHLLAGLAGSNPDGDLTATVQSYLAGLKGGLSVMDRLRGRAIESFHMVRLLMGLPTKAFDGNGNMVFTGGWIKELHDAKDKNGATALPPVFSVPVNPPVTTKSGFGLIEAPRGALGHFVTAAQGQIQSYQCVVPTTWNGSPKDGPDSGIGTTTHRGAMEESMIGVTFDSRADAGYTGDRLSGVEVLRVAHTFDPCIACAVH